MKKQLKASLSILVLTIVTSCSKMTIKKNRQLLENGSFLRRKIYNESNQEALVDYTHRCETKKKIICSLNQMLIIKIAMHIIVKVKKIRLLMF